MFGYGLDGPNAKMRSPGRPNSLVTKPNQTKLGSNSSVAAVHPRKRWRQKCCEILMCPMLDNDEALL